MDDKARSSFTQEWIDYHFFCMICIYKLLLVPDILSRLLKLEITITIMDLWHTYNVKIMMCGKCREKFEQFYFGKGFEKTYNKM